MTRFFDFVSRKAVSANMSKVIDLTGDGEVTKTIIKTAKPGSVGPTDSTLIVDGTVLLLTITSLAASTSCAPLSKDVFGVSFTRPLIA